MNIEYYNNGKLTQDAHLLEIIIRHSHINIVSLQEG